MSADTPFYFLEVNTRLQVEHPRHRASHRRRSGARADRGRARRSAAVDTGGARAARTRDRSACLRRGSGERTSCRRPDRCCSTASRRCPASASIPASSKGRDHRPLRSARREADRRRRNARARDRPADRSASRLSNPRHPHQRRVSAARARSRGFRAGRDRHGVPGSTRPALVVVHGSPPKCRPMLLRHLRRTAACRQRHHTAQIPGPPGMAADSVTARSSDGVYRVEHDGRADLVYVAGPAHDRWAFANGEVYRQTAGILEAAQDITGRRDRDADGPDARDGAEGLGRAWRARQSRRRARRPRSHENGDRPASATRWRRHGDTLP